MEDDNGEGPDDTAGFLPATIRVDTSRYGSRYQVRCLLGCRAGTMRCDAACWRCDEGTRQANKLVEDEKRGTVVIKESRRKAEGAIAMQYYSVSL